MSQTVSPFTSSLWSGAGLPGVGDVPLQGVRGEKSPGIAASRARQTRAEDGVERRATRRADQADDHGLALAGWRLPQGPGAASLPGHPGLRAPGAAANATGQLALTVAHVQVGRGQAARRQDHHRPTGPDVGH